MRMCLYYLYSVIVSKCFKHVSPRHSYVVGYPKPRKIQDITNEYKLSIELGKGSSADVLHAIHLNENHRYAAKRFDKRKMNEIDILFLRREVNMMRQIFHTHIVSYYDFIEDNSHYYIIMEFVMSSMQTHLAIKGKYTEKNACVLFRSLLQAINYIHSLNIIHRDIKLANILVSREDDTNIKVCDFGLAIFIGDNGKAYDKCGTLNYVAPEILSGDQGGYGKQVDMWSAGIVLFALLHGKLPFNCQTPSRLREVIANGEYGLEKSNISFQAKDFIQKLLSVVPYSRLNAKEALEHDWLL